MTAETRKNYQGYGFLAGVALNVRQLDQLIVCFQLPAQASGATLGGRRQMPTLTLDPFGPLVVKSYQRGGLLGRFNHQYYFKLKAGSSRSAEEYAWLNHVRAMGINAPEPLAAVHRGLLAYRCWLVTREIRGAISLAQLSIDRPTDIDMDQVCATCARQIEILVENRIRHPDLHPGNVLLDRGGQSWLIDFDKAHHYRGPRQRLAVQYRRRWVRAIRKHGLPPALGAAMQISSNGRQD